MTLAVTDRLLAALEGFSGTLLLPGDPGYEHARGVFNALVDKRPALIARCQGVADIVAAVKFAREHGLEVSIRGGGHGVAGAAVPDGGVMIDLSRLKGIRVDPQARTARAQGGVTLGELNRETQLHGLAVPAGIVSTTGIAGLTLGGGHGWITGKYGLTVDNLLSAEMVTADGRVLRAGREEHEDLFWALRGGGGNFGVVSSFEYRLHPVGPLVTGGLVLHPASAAREFLRFHRDFMADAPDELGADAALLSSPDGSGGKLVGLALCHVGPPGQADEDLRALLSFGSPVEVQVSPMAYTAVNSMLDGANPPGRLNYWKSGFLAALSDEAIDTMVTEFERSPSRLSALTLRLFRGAATRVPVTETACPHRDESYNVAVSSVWSDPHATDENAAWARETFAALEPFLAQRRWVSFLDFDDAGDDALRSAYGPNYQRLAEVKAAYDPAGFFGRNFDASRAGTTAQEGG